MERHVTRREIIAMSRCERWFAHSLGKPHAKCSSKSWLCNGRISQSFGTSIEYKDRVATVKGSTS